MDPITYETGTYRTSALDYRLTRARPYPHNVFIEHRKHNSKWWDIAYGEKNHTQAVWDAIKKEGVKIA